MCNPTSSPPRREMYELEESMRTSDGPFFVVKKPLPRLTVRSWTSGRVAIYNADFASNGERFLTLAKPWTVVTPSAFRAFLTFEEAVSYAFQTPDPAPQEQSSVTTGWQPVPDHADEWQEKWNLTR